MKKPIFLSQYFFVGSFQKSMRDSNATCVRKQCKRWHLGNKKLHLRRVIVALYRRLEEIAGKMGPLDLAVKGS